MNSQPKFTRPNLSLVDFKPTNPLEEIPPHDLKVESAVLGCMILEKRAFEVARDTLTKDEFYADRYRIIFVHMIEVSGHVDELCLRNSLKRSDLLQSIGGEDSLSRLLDPAPSIGSIENYCEDLRKFSRQRKAREVASKLLTEGGNPDDVIKNASDALAIIDSAPEKNEETLESRIEANIDGSRYALSHPDFQCLGSTLCFLPGTTTLLVSSPGVSKSLLVAQWTWRLFEDGFDPSLLALESGYVCHEERMLAQMCGEPRIMRPDFGKNNPDLNRQYYSRYGETLKEIKAKGILRAPKPGTHITASHIEKYVRGEAQRGRQLIIVDPWSMISFDNVAVEGRKLVHVLIGIMEKYQSRLLIVAHPKNTAKGMEMSDAGGCAALTQNTSATLWLEAHDMLDHVFEDEGAPIGEKMQRRKYNRTLHIKKVRGPKSTGKIGYHMDSATLLHSEVGFVS